MPTPGTTASTLHPAQERMLAAMFDDRQPATRADVQALAGILSALAVGGLAALNAYVLWRDRIRGRQQGEPR